MWVLGPPPNPPSSANRSLHFIEGILGKLLMLHFLGTEEVPIVGRLTDTHGKHWSAGVGESRIEIHLIATHLPVGATKSRLPLKVLVL